MALAKRTYTLPPDVLEPFEQRVSVGNRSAVIAELLREWAIRQEEERLRQEVKEWVEDMGEIYLEIEREFRPLDEELWRALDDDVPEAR